MEIAKIQVNGVCAEAVWCMGVPHGMIGGQIGFEFDASWKGLTKTVVFDGCCTKDVLNADGLVTIPAEVVAKPGAKFRVGVYGVDGRNQVVIPTLWAELGTVRYGADPSADVTTDPQLPVWAQLQNMIESGGHGGAGIAQITIQEV